MTKSLITATLPILLAVSTTATAGPLNKGWVADDAQWVIHVDVEAFKASTVGQFMLEHADSFDIDEDELDEIKEHTGLDPREDLMSVTLYGAGDEPGEDGVIVAVASDRVDEAIEMLMDNDDIPIRKREMDGRTIYMIGGDDDRHYFAIERAGRDRRIVVLTDTRRRLSHALQVIADDAPSLSMGKSDLPREEPQDGSIAFVAVGDIEAFGDDDPASQILRLSDGFTADIGEVDGVVMARAAVSAESEEVAGDISQVIQGMVALGRIMAAQEPDLAPLAKLADSLSVRTRGTRISLKISYDARALMEQIMAMAEADDDDDDGGWDDDDDDDDEWDDDDDDDDDRHHRKRERKRKRSHDD